MRFTILTFCLLNAACLAEVGGDECVGQRCLDGSGSGSGSATAPTDCDEPEELREPITIRSASDFDALPEGCWSLNATLRLEGAGVTSAAGLGRLLEVNDLEVVDTALTSFAVESPIQVWGSLLVSGNSRLTRLDNLEITRWDGETANDVPFSVAYVVHDNAALMSLEGLRYIARVDRDLRITDNARLGAVELPELATVGGAIQISNTGVTAIRLANLTSAGRLEITRNPQLTTIGTASSLATISGALTIDDNDALTDLGALTSQLSRIGGALAVTNNARLSGIGRLGRLATAIGSSITITGNPQLPQCAAVEVAHCVTGGSAVIENNLDQGSCSCWCGR